MSEGSYSSNSDYSSAPPPENNKPRGMGGPVPSPANQESDVENISECSTKSFESFKSEEEKQEERRGMYIPRKETEMAQEESGVIEDDEEMKKKKKKRKDSEEQNELDCCDRIGCIIVGILLFLTILATIVLIYLVFANLLQYTFYPLFYEWVSTYSKKSTFDLVMTVFASLSDYGIFFSLIFVAWELIRNFFDIIKMLAINMLQAITGVVSLNQKFEKMGKQLACIAGVSIVYIAVVVLGLIFYKFLAVLITLFIMLIIVIVIIIPSLILICSLCNDDDKKNENYVENEDEDENENKGEDDNGGLESLQKTINFVTDYTQMIVGTRGFKCGGPERKNPKKEERDEDDKYYKCGFLVKFIFALLVIVGQAYVIYASIINFNDIGKYGRIGVVFGIVIRVLSLLRSIDINIYDSIFYVYKFWGYLKHMSCVISYFITIIIYIIAIFFLVFIKIYLVTKDKPDVRKITYEENNELWIRNLNNNITTYNKVPGFCSVTTNIESPFKTDDFAMMLTLPRLYEIDSNKKCRIKTHLRGVFNSTMKYIFGQNYQDQNITILCYPYTNNPYLIITSDTLLQDLEDTINMTNATFHDRQFEPVSNDYFANLPLNDGRALSYYKTLESCIQNKLGNCSKQWEEYTNAYWATFYDKPNDTELIGLEQYQYTLNETEKIEPRFTDQNGKDMNGLHIVIGGAFEDDWGYGYHIENLVRVNIPSIFEQFIPFFSLVTGQLNDVFSVLSEFIYGVIYVETLSYEEMVGFSDMMSRFNFDHESIFMVGHSISGTTVKEFSFVSDVPGIVFEASIGLNYAQFRLSDNYEKIEDYTNQIANIYSSTVITSGNDDTFAVNGELPSLFYNPNVFDTACLVAATCSPTKRYQKFCKQVLNQGNADPEKKFQEIVDAYYNKYQ